MMCVPERFVGLLSDLLVRGRVDQHHAQEHYVACNAACLLVMHLNRRFRPDLVSFDIEKAIIPSINLPRIGRAVSHT